MKGHNPKAVRILGVDPGSLACGYGVIDVIGGKAEYVSSGRILLPGKLPLPERLRELHEGLSEVIGKFKPDAAAVEKMFFAKSARAAISLGQARGVAVLAVAEAGIEAHEFTAVAVKKAVSGFGRAEKSQVEKMVRRLLNIEHALSPDSADALAIAICLSNSLALNEAIGAKRR